MTTTLPEVQVIDVNAELIKENLTDTVIAELSAKYMLLKIEGIEDRRGYEIVRAARIDCKKIRVMVEKVCKKAREGAINYQRYVIGKEKEVVGKISVIETHLASEQALIDSETQRLKEEKERHEQERIQQRIDRLFRLGMTFNGQIYGANFTTHRIDAVQIKLASEEMFAGFCAGIEIDFQKEQERLTEIKRKEDEERERLQIERESQEKERQRLTEERQLQDQRAAELKAEQDKINDEKKAIETAKIKAQELSDHKAEIEKAKKETETRVKMEMEEKAKRQEEAKAKAAQKERDRLKRVEETKPDRDKIISFANLLKTLPYPEIKDVALKSNLNVAKQKINNITDELLSAVAKVLTNNL